MSSPFATSAPLVSVIIPAYNSAAFVLQAVQSALDQTYRNYEVIVVDDGSTDDTKLLLSRFEGQLRYLYQENRGLSDARNTGLKAAKGDLVCFLDADDLWASNKLELQLAFLQEHPDIALLSGQQEKFRDHGSPYTPFSAAENLGENATQTFPMPEAFVKLVRSNFIKVSTVMVRKECFEKAGLFDTNLTAVEDRDMWLRISAHFSVACFPWVVCKKRLHGLNMSGNRTRQIRLRIQVLEKNRALFPALAPSSAWDKQLGKLYLRTAYDSLSRDQSKEARRAALRSLRYHPSIKAAVLVLATCTAR
jgi:glycosyltransferase involved in cell wall biosynthesis